MAGSGNESPIGFAMPLLPEPEELRIESQIIVFRTIVFAVVTLIVEPGTASTTWSPRSRLKNTASPLRWSVKWKKRNLQGKGERIRSIITRNARLGKTPIEFVFLSNSEADPADSIAPLLD